MSVVGETRLTKVPPLLERAKLGFVVALRGAFASEITDENLRYNEVPELSKIRIFTAHPRTLEFYPSLVVSTGGGDASFTYLSDDFVEETNESDSSGESGTVTFAGRLVFTVALTVLSKSTLERERIVDHLILFIRHLFRPNIHAFGIEYTKDIRLGPEVLVEVENTPVYEQVIDIPCYMEYEAIVDQKMLDTIRRINMNLVNFSVAL